MNDPYETDSESETWTPNLFQTDAPDEGYETSDEADSGYESEWPTYNGEDY